MLNFIVAGLSLSFAQTLLTPTTASKKLLTETQDRETFATEAESQFREYFATVADKNKVRPIRLLRLCEQLHQAGVLRLQYPTIQGLSTACQTKNADGIRDELVQLGSKSAEFNASLAKAMAGQNSEVAFKRKLSEVLRSSDTPLLTLGIYVLTFAHAQTPATRLDDVIAEHPDENSFVTALENMFRARFANPKDSGANFNLCQKLGSTGTFGLPHPSLRALGMACDGGKEVFDEVEHQTKIEKMTSEEQARAIRDEFAKFGQPKLVQEFATAVRQHVQARGSVEAFADNLSTTLPGNEKPLLAFGIFVLFAT